VKWIELIQRFMEPKVKGIIHVGANDCEEYEEYKAAGIGRMLLIEPQESAFLRLKERVGNDQNVSIMKVACGAVKGRITLNLMKGPGEHHDYSTSVLIPSRHLELHPCVEVVGQEDADLVPLDDAWGTLCIPRKSFNLLVCDVQGYEKEVISGAGNTLDVMDYILCEVNQEEVYAGCVLVGEMDLILSGHGFTRIMTDWCGPRKAYGDALYIRRE
jgi:FkbM family methyltransferase